VTFFVVLPLGVIAATPPLEDGGREAVILDVSLLPVSSDIRLQSTAEGDGVRLSWAAARPGSASVFYRLLRTKGASDVFCAGTRAADECRLYAGLPASTRATSYTDRPGSGTWTYRIGVSANWLDDERLGDIYVVSSPATATVP